MTKTNPVNRDDATHRLLVDAVRVSDLSNDHMIAILEILDCIEVSSVMLDQADQGDREGGREPDYPYRCGVVEFAVTGYRDALDVLRWALSFELKDEVKHN